MHAMMSISLLHDSSAVKTKAAWVCFDGHDIGVNSPDGSDMNGGLWGKLVLSSRLIVMEALFLILWHNKLSTIGISTYRS